MGTLDAAIVVGGTEIQVNRDAICSDSPYFTREFGAKGMRVDVPEDVDPQVLRCLVTVCHNTSRDAIARWDSYILMQSAQLGKRLEFKIARKRLLREVIFRTPEKDERPLCEKIWDLPPNSLYLWDILAKRFNIFLMTALSHITLSKVLLSSELMLDYRNMLRIIIEWRKVHPNADKAMLDTLLKHARFDALSQEEVSVLIANQCMPHGRWLQNRIDGNRSSLLFLHVDRALDPNYETVERIKVPNFAAALHAPNQYNGYGCARIELPISLRKVDTWKYNPRPFGRFFVTVGDYAVSIWFAAAHGWLYASVVIDRRLCGKKSENLLESVGNLELQVYIGTKTPEYRKQDFSVNTQFPAIGACRSKILSRSANEWEGHHAFQIMSQDEATRLITMRRNRDNTILQSLVDIRLVKPRNGTNPNS